MDHGEAAKISWDQIRSYEWNIPGKVTYRASGFVDQSTTAMANAAERTQALRDSGFFIDVIDINKPRWQFMSNDEKVLTKWMEIFRQIKEGTLA